MVNMQIRRGSGAMSDMMIRVDLGSATRLCFIPAAAAAVISQQMGSRQWASIINKSRFIRRIARIFIKGGVGEGALKWVIISTFS